MERHRSLVVHRPLEIFARASCQVGDRANHLTVGHHLMEVFARGIAARQVGDAVAHGVAADHKAKAFSFVG